MTNDDYSRTFKATLTIKCFHTDVAQTTVMAKAFDYEAQLHHENFCKLYPALKVLGLSSQHY